MDLIHKLITLVILLGFSAFFSGSETAVFSINNTIRFKKLQRSNRDVSFLGRFLNDPARLLITVLIGNMVVNVIAASLATTLCVEIFGDNGLAIAIVGMTLLLLIFGEVSPKTYAIYRAEDVSLAVARPLWVISKLLFPFRVVLRRLTDKIIGTIPTDGVKEPTLTEEEFKTVIELGHKEGVVKKYERDMIRSVLEFTDTTADEVMAPRVDIRAVPIDYSREQFVRFARENRFSKIPVYINSLDKIMGVIYVKDVFLNEQKDLKDLIKPVLFVPGAKKINELFELFDEQKIKIAVVVDNYGGTDGIITLEDIQEEIFGELYDEFEMPAQAIEDLGQGRFRIKAEVPLGDVNEQLAINLPEEEETLAGFVLGLFGKIPRETEQASFQGKVFEIEKLAGRRIKSIIVQK